MFKDAGLGPEMSFGESLPLPGKDCHCGGDGRTAGVTEEPGLLLLCSGSPTLQGSQHPCVGPWSAGLRGPGTV